MVLPHLGDYFRRWLAVSNSAIPVIDVGQTLARSFISMSPPSHYGVDRPATAGALVFI